MNKRQKFILWVGLSLMVVRGLIPPWSYKSAHSESPAGFYFLGDPPTARGGVHIDFAQLLLWWAIIAAPTVTLMLTINKQSAAQSPSVELPPETAPHSGIGARGCQSPSVELPPEKATAEQSAKARPVSTFLHDEYAEPVEVKKEPRTPPVNNRDLPTKWLTMWGYCKLPLSCAMTWSVLLEVDLSVFATWRIALVILIGLFYIAVGVGLNRRKLWAWKANWVVIFGETLFGILRNFEVQPNTEQFIGYIIGLSMFGFLWAWPNYIYFRKRKCLFK
jgi:hypothetical protein